MKAYQNLIYGAIATLLLFTSCCLGDVVLENEYLVTNSTDTPILVDVSSERSMSMDSLFTIQNGQTMTVLTTVARIVSPCEDEDWNPENIDRDLDAFSVTNQDSILSTRNYLDGDEWNFDEGIYRITVEQGEF